MDPLTNDREAQVLGAKKYVRNGGPSFGLATETVAADVETQDEMSISTRKTGGSNGISIGAARPMNKNKKKNMTDMYELFESVTWRSEKDKSIVKFVPSSSDPKNVMEQLLRHKSRPGIDEIVFANACANLQSVVNRRYFATMDDEGRLAFMKYFNRTGHGHHDEPGGGGGSSAGHFRGQGYGSGGMRYGNYSGYGGGKYGSSSGVGVRQYDGTSARHYRGQTIGMGSMRNVNYSAYTGGEKQGSGSGVGGHNEVGYGAYSGGGGSGGWDQGAGAGTGGDS